MTRPGQLLDVRDVTVRLGGVVANNRVCMEAEPGAVTALIGPNGAGKTTLINAVTGFVKATGQVRIGDRDISREPPHKRRRLGLARTWQAGELFDSLSVLDNVRVADETVDITWLVRDLLPADRTAEKAALALLEHVGLADMATALPSELSLGQQRLVGVARALAGNPSVLLLDEPAAGLDSEESMVLGGQLREISDSGTTVVLVDHDVNLIFSVAHHVYVLDFGEVIAAGSPETVQRDPRVIQAYLGASLSLEEGA
jgi:branched-chain amino acid transport system ATP-binding protein